MNLAGVAIKKRAVTYFFSVLLLVGGVASFFQLGWLEDPTFTVKKATITTLYPGASPYEVEQEVTDILERALQELPQLESVYSYSRAGMSILFVEIRNQYWSDRLPQVWDEMRNKIEDYLPYLPPGATKPDIADDFAFVYGFLMALTGEGFSYSELEDYAENIQKELAVVPGVARVTLWGVQDRVVYVDASQRQLSELGITPQALTGQLIQQNLVVDAGFIDIRDKRYRIAPTGTFSSPEEIEEITFRPNVETELIQAGDIAQREPSSEVYPLRNPSRTGELIKLKDIATVEAGYLEPPQTLMRFNGQPAIAIALANAEGGNIVETGKLLDQRIAELEEILPVGIEMHPISWQSDIVKASIVDFMINLAEAVAIVLIVLTIPVGWRMGLVIGMGLVFTVAGTIMMMMVFGIDLHRMSLGALVIALGMMVDNSIVVADNYSVKVKQGMDRIQAAREAANLPAWPLVGATLIATLAFYPIYASTDDAGEYCRDLFTVVGIALSFSWIVAMTITPVQCLDILKVEPGAEGAEVKEGAFFSGFRGFLGGAIRFKFPFVFTMIGLLVAAMIGFTTLPQNFFPDSARAQFMVDFWAPEGTRIQDVAERTKAIEEQLLQDELVTDVSTFIGQGPPRFYLPVDSELPFQSFANIIINTKSGSDVPEAAARIEAWLADNVADAVPRVRLYGLGVNDTWKFEARFTGPMDADLGVLREAGERGKQVLERSPLAKEIRTDMRNRVLRLVPDYDDERARWADISRENLAFSTKRAFDGVDVGLYREGDDLLPIKLRLVEDERNNLGGFDIVQVSNPTQLDTVPLSQVVDDVRFEWEDPLIMRWQRRRVNTVQASPKDTTFPSLYASVIDEFREIEESLPPGYDLWFDGERYSTWEAQTSLTPGIIPAVVVIVFTLVYLFNSIKKMAVIVLVIPFIFVGISPALMATQVPFGFVAMLGAMSLAGMMIKNAIVLIEQVNVELEEGKSQYDAIVNATVSRVRPVMLAAGTTVLGVVPLLQDVFWVGMSITIMSGLTMGTILTLVLLPALYAIFFGIKKPTSQAAAPTAAKPAPA